MNKSAILDHCITLVESRLTSLEDELRSLSESQKNETKSSMGDKYETAREMINREKQNLMERQLHTRNMLHTLRQIDGNRELSKGGKGALIRTDQNAFLIITSLGSISFENHTIFVISENSPIGRLLQGKCVGDSFVFNNQPQQIIEVS